jgi:sialic acid synthase SpsE
MLEALALDESAHVELKAHADSSAITFMSSPFDEEAVDLLERVGVPAIKVPSGELTNFQLLRRIADSGLPIVMSTGMSTLDEVDDAVGQLSSARHRLALLHCVSSYPADPKDCNLLAIELMRTRYGVPIGWSDHTEGIAIASAAVAVGADIVEKHVTMSRNLPGPDQSSSIEPEELRAMVTAIRSVQAALGAAEKRPSSAERAIAGVARKSLHWRRALVPGERVAPKDLLALRPGTGIPPGKIGELVGRQVRVKTIVGSLARFDDFDDPMLPGRTS